MNRIKILHIIAAAIIICFILSCGTSTKVVSNHFLTKRKYNKGWYVNNITKKQESTKQKHADTPLFPNDTLTFSEVAAENEIHQELFASNELNPVIYKESKRSILQYPTISAESDTSKTIKREKKKKRPVINITKVNLKKQTQMPYFHF